jgi:hypothetical protein
MKVPRILAVSVLVACGPPAQERAMANDPSTPASVDSLTLTSATGTQVWFTLAREAMGADHQRCVERGLEIRDGRKRVKVPLLYTGAAPTLLDDSTMRAVLWTHCEPGDTYRVNLRTGQPVRERKAGAS